MTDAGRETGPWTHGAEVEPLVLAPARQAAAVWTSAGVLAFAAVLWILVDSRGHPLAWVVAAVVGSVTLFFAVQLTFPKLFSLRLDDRGMRGRMLVTSVDVAWRDVQLARVRTVAGDPMLELYVQQDGDPEPRGMGVLLPVGAEVATLHAFLAQRLGRAHDR